MNEYEVMSNGSYYKVKAHSFDFFDEKLCFYDENEDNIAVFITWDFVIKKVN